MPGAHQNVQSLGAGGLYGTLTSVGAGGYGPSQPVARSEMDQLRLGQGRTPSAEYPDGYLGTINDRRSDRLLDSLKSRENQRAYQRGVHKGERIDPSDYYYPKGLDDQRGLRAQARGMRQAPVTTLAPPPHLVNDGKSDIPNEIPAQLDPKRVAQFSGLLPTWR